MPAGSTVARARRRARAALTARAAWGRQVVFVRRARGDRLRLVLGAALLLLTLPGLQPRPSSTSGDVFLGEEVPPVRDRIAAVHLGFHRHRRVLLSLTALLLSRIPPGDAAGYLSLMLAYGLANALQDSWNEQLWRRRHRRHTSRACSVRISPGAGS